MGSAKLRAFLPKVVEQWDAEKVFTLTETAKKQRKSDLGSKGPFRSPQWLFAMHDGETVTDSVLLMCFLPKILI